ncbi:MAG TPA: OmpA family protein [Bacteroidales bacterium]|nr:OmpA family protein [Bacteroidales bacterium]
MNKKKFTIIAILIFFSALVAAQNLIQNSCFDQYYTYIDLNKNLVYAPSYWYYCDSAFNHPIYFCTDRYKNKSLSWNYHPDSTLIKEGGNADYISLLLLPNTQKTFTYLHEPLVKGEKYLLTIDVKAFEQSNYFADLWVGFKNNTDCETDTGSFQLYLSLPDSVCTPFLYYNWVTLSKEFIANGNDSILLLASGSAKDYRKMVISNKEKFQIKKYYGNPKLKYFIDNVFLYRIENCLTHSLDSLNKDESVVLNHIFFDFDKYDILPKSYPQLDSVYNFMERNKTVKILISGHTDNYGSEDYNKTLSFRRASSVANYIINKGISDERIIIEGIGEKNPIASNHTEQNRRKNRRIEMKILEK